LLSAHTGREFFVKEVDCWYSGDRVYRLEEDLEEIERRHILGAQEKTDWRLTGTGGAAEILQMKKLGLTRHKDLPK
jgi:hypothetical protein